MNFQSLVMLARFLTLCTTTYVSHVLRNDCGELLVIQAYFYKNTPSRSCAEIIFPKFKTTRFFLFHRDIQTLCHYNHQFHKMRTSYFFKNRTNIQELYSLTYSINKSYFFVVFSYSITSILSGETEPRKKQSDGIHHFALFVLYILSSTLASTSR